MLRDHKVSACSKPSRNQHPSRFLWLQRSFAFFCITLPVSGTIFKLIWTVKYSYFSRRMNVFLDLFIFKGNPSLHENSRHRLPVAGMWRCARGKGHWPLLPAVPVRMGASRGGGRTGSVQSSIHRFCPLKWRGRSIHSAMMFQKLPNPFLYNVEILLRAGNAFSGLQAFLRRVAFLVISDFLVRKAWLPTPVFFPGESQGQRSLVGYSPWGCKELDTTE